MRLEGFTVDLGLKRRKNTKKGKKGDKQGHEKEY